MIKSKLKPVIEGTIEAVAFGGRGILKHDGKVFFVEGGLPGDRVRVQVTKEKKTFGEGYVTTLLEPSEIRTPSPCIYSDQCGGCQWLEAPKAHQDNWKQEFITSALKRIAKVDHSLETFFSSPDALHYRNRVSLKGIYTKSYLKVGYYRQRSHELIAIKTCKIAENPINQCLEQVNRLDLPPTEKDYSFDLDLQVLFDGRIMAFLKMESSSPKKVQANILRALEKIPSLSTISSRQTESPQLHLYDEQFGLQYFTYQGQFQQVNRKANHILRETIATYVAELKPRLIVDLFCGSGNLSLHLAHDGCEVIGIESNPRSIVTAKHNVRHNKLTNLDYLCLSSEDFLKDYASRSAKPDLVMIDPPRRGLEESISDLVAMEAKAILYVSCDPNTLARDIGVLQSHGYEIQKGIGFDFFPNTYHVESLVVLKKP